MNDSQSIRDANSLVNGYMLASFVVLLMIGELCLLFFAFWSEDMSTASRFALAAVAVAGFLVFRKMLHLIINTIMRLRAGDPEWAMVKDWSNPRVGRKKE